MRVFRLSDAVEAGFKGGEEIATVNGELVRGTLCGPYGQVGQESIGCALQCVKSQWQPKSQLPKTSF